MEYNPNKQLYVKKFASWGDAWAAYRANNAGYYDDIKSMFDYGINNTLTSDIQDYLGSQLNGMSSGDRFKYYAQAALSPLGVDFGKDSVFNTTNSKIQDYAKKQGDAVRMQYQKDWADTYEQNFRGKWSNAVTDKNNRWKLRYAQSLMQPKWDKKYNLNRKDHGLLGRVSRGTISENISNNIMSSSGSSWNVRNKMKQLRTLQHGHEGTAGTDYSNI